MAERGALRVAGRARGELDVDGVVELQLRPELGELHLLGIAAGARDVVEVQHARRLLGPQPHDVLEMRQLARLHQVRRDLEIVRGLERRRQDQRLALDLVHGVLELGAPVGRVDVDQHQPRLGGGELRQGPFVACWATRCRCGRRAPAPATAGRRRDRRPAGRARPTSSARSDGAPPAPRGRDRSRRCGRRRRRSSRRSASWPKRRGRKRFGEQREHWSCGASLARTWQI